LRGGQVITSIHVDLSPPDCLAHGLSVLIPFDGRRALAGRDSTRPETKRPDTVVLAAMTARKIFLRPSRRDLRVRAARVAKVAWDAG
jgi:hypothetical protein